jgi:hypothetical protein
MQRQSTRWRADRGTRALKRLAEIETSIAALDNDDLLDLADIFASARGTPLNEVTSAEMQRRNIKL